MLLYLQTFVVSQVKAEFCFAPLWLCFRGNALLAGFNFSQFFPPVLASACFHHPDEEEMENECNDELTPADHNPGVATCRRDASSQIR